MNSLRSRFELPVQRTSRKDPRPGWAPPRGDIGSDPHRQCRQTRQTPFQSGSVEFVYIVDRGRHQTPQVIDIERKSLFFGYGDKLGYVDRALGLTRYAVVAGAPLLGRLNSRTTS